MKARLGTIGCWFFAILFYGGIASGIVYFLYRQWETNRLGQAATFGGWLLLACVVFAGIGYVWASAPKWFGGTRLAWLTQRDTWVMILSTFCFGWLVWDSRGSKLDEWGDLFSLVVVGAIANMLVSVFSAAIATQVLKEEDSETRGFGPNTKRAIVTAQVTIIVIAVGWLLIGGHDSIGQPQ